MLSLDDLKAKARQTTAVAGVTDTLVLDAHVPAEQMVSGLMQYFGEADERKAIRLTADGEEMGYLRRADLYGYEKSTLKGIGIGDYSTIPGTPDFRMLRLRCPVAGCPYRPLVMVFDEDNPPQCEVHPGTAMEIV
jgi:hypothetical protein